MIQVLVSYPTSRDKLVVSGTTEEYTGTLDGKILYIWDVIDDQTLLEILSKYGLPKYIAADSLSYYSSSVLREPMYVTDMWLETELENFEYNGISHPVVQNLQTKHTANFQINKKQINRYLAIKFCEIFDISVNYTWSGIGKYFDLTHIIDEQNKINDPVIGYYWEDIFAPITKFDQKWLYKGNLNIENKHGISEYGGNINSWNNGLNSIVSNTAISLITESVATQQAMTFTEKTAYSVLGLTFPIWVGGYRSATEWKNKGFDVFEDIIDHSYECMPTLIERCFYAFYLNKDILTDTTAASQLRTTHMERLVNNRKKLTSDTLNKHNKKIIETWPPDLQEPMIKAMQDNLHFINK